MAVGDWLRVLNGRVHCPIHHASVPVSACSRCGFGTPIDPEGVGWVSVIRCTARAALPVAAKSVLVVDADAGSAQALAQLLRHDGFVVEIVPDGAAAIARLATDPLPAVLVTELLLPHVGGAAIATFARSRWAAIPVILVTTRPAAAAEVSSRLSPPGVVFGKPVEYRDVVTAIERALAESGAAPPSAG